MLRLFKIIAIILTLIFVIIGLIATCTGVVMVKGVKSAIQEAERTYPQTVTMTPDGAEVTTAAQGESKIVLDGVELCHAGPDEAGYVSTDWCMNEKCQATLDFGDAPIPDSVTIHRKYNGNCIEQTIPQLMQYKVTQYKEKVGINPDLRKQLGVADNIQPVKTAKTQGSFGYIQINDTTAVSLDYGSVKPQEDEFGLGSKVIRVKYTADSPVSAPSATVPVR